MAYQIALIIKEMHIEVFRGKVPLVSATYIQIVKKLKMYEKTGDRMLTIGKLGGGGQGYTNVYCRFKFLQIPM